MSEDRQPILRAANDSDRAALEALEAASFTQDRIASRSWRRLLRRPSALVLVAARGPHLAGALVLLFRRGSGVARVYSLAVAAAERGRGIARLLLGHAADASAGRGCRAIRLETRLDNAPAQALFRREGFAVTGRTERYYEDGMAALRLERPLPLAHSR
jgi:ribosomal protein S18 acetylase RimI-like enzyme